MNVRVTNVRTTASGEREVTFSCDAGIGVALWHGMEQPPESVDVELDITDQLLWGKSIEEVESGRDALSAEGRKTVIVAPVESVDDDGVVAIRFCGSIVLLETLGRPTKDPAMVRAECLHLCLYPTGI